MMAGEGSTMTSFSDPNPCPICLSQVTQDSYLDQCFHKFCYSCIKKWMNIVASSRSGLLSSFECPLCKTENLSIIHGYDGAAFQRDYAGENAKNSEFFTEAHRYRLKCYYTEQVDLANELKVSSYWMARKYRQQTSFLGDWLKREIQAILRDEDVDIIVHHITGAFDALRRGWSKDRVTCSADMARKQFKTTVSEASRPFLTGRTERFVSELEVFMASGLSIDAFDDVYIKHLRGGNGERDDDEPLVNESLVLNFDEQDFL